MTASEPEPAYSLIPIVQTPIVNPGKNLEIAVYISGTGSVEHSKLVIENPRNVFSKEQKNGITRVIGEYIFNFTWVTENLAVWVENRNVSTGFITNRGSRVDVSPLFQSQEWAQSQFEDQKKKIDFKTGNVIQREDSDDSIVVVPHARIVQLDQP